MNPFRYSQIDRTPDYLKPSKKGVQATTKENGKTFELLVRRSQDELTRLNVNREYTPK